MIVYCINIEDGRWLKVNISGKISKKIVADYLSQMYGYTPIGYNDNNRYDEEIFLSKSEIMKFFNKRSVDYDGR